MLDEICSYLHNWFCDDEDKHFDVFTVEDGGMTLPFLVAGQYYRIVGSTFNDGVHKYGDSSDTLTDETFDGAVWAMAVPPAVIVLAGEIATWQAANGNSAYTSESFGGYTYQRASNGNGGLGSWRTAFKARLAPWRKM